MPQSPSPNLFRAFIGFPLGMFLGGIVTGIVRYMQGLGVYLIDVNIADRVFSGWFWEDEASFTFILVFGAVGFLWGAGMVYDFEKAKQRQKAIVPRRRVPVDPDAPPDLGKNPLLALLDALPSIGTTIMVTIALVIILSIVPIWDGNPISGTQTTNEAAETDEFGTTSYNFLGLVEVQDVSQAQVFFLFAGVAILSILGLSVVLALAVFLVNRMLKITENEQPDPEAGQSFLPIRLVAFFNDWIIDILNGVQSILRPR